MMNADAHLNEYMHQWGAKAVPFQSGGHTPLFETEASRDALELLQQTAALRSVMLLSGANGVGKSALIAHWMRTLEPKRFRPMALTQATLSASGLLATLLAKMGQEPSGRRCTNLARMEKAFAQLAGVIPVVLLDEAQSYSPSAMEELRMLLGLNLPARPSFALVLVGDDYLLDTLRLQSRRALYTRIAATYRIPSLTPEQVQAYVRHHLTHVGIDRPVFEPPALQLMAAASDGVPRIINLIATAAWINASREQHSTISPQDLSAALKLVPAARDRTSNNTH